MIGREEFLRSKEGNRNPRKRGRLFQAPVEERKLKMDRKGKQNANGRCSGNEKGILGHTQTDATPITPI